MHFLLPWEEKFYLGKHTPLVGSELLERVHAELKSYRNTLAWTLAALVGAGKDANKGQEIFSKGRVEIDSRVYLLHSCGSVGSWIAVLSMNPAISAP